MIATIPASAVLKNRPWRAGIAGTIWNGEVGVVGGARFEWHWAPLRSLTSLGFAADWKGTGPNTDIGGRALLRPGHVTLDQVSGSASGSLIGVFQPNLPFTCDFAMQVDMPRIATGGSDQRVQGTIHTAPGACTAKTTGGATAVPAMVFTADPAATQTGIRLVPAAHRRQALIEATLASDGALDLTVTPEGARVLPFLGIPAGFRIQGQL